MLVVEVRLSVNFVEPIQDTSPNLLFTAMSLLLEFPSCHLSIELNYNGWKLWLHASYWLNSLAPYERMLHNKYWPRENYRVRRISFLIFFSYFSSFLIFFLILGIGKAGACRWNSICTATVVFTMECRHIYAYIYSYTIKENKSQQIRKFEIEMFGLGPGTSIIESSNHRSCTNLFFLPLTSRPVKLFSHLNMNN